MASKHPISRANRSPAVKVKQFATPISTSREQHSRCDVKPPISTHTHSRPCSAKIRDLTEKCDVLHQDLENDRQCIAQLHKDVTQSNEVHKQLCVRFGRKIAGAPMMVEDIQAQLIELLQKLNNYYVEIGKLKENSNELKRRLMQLSGRCLANAKKRKDIKEQQNALKNLIKRPKAQESLSLQQLRAATNPELNKSVESVKEGKSDIKAQFGQYQSELDELIITEKRLKEIINGLQASHNTIKQDIQKIKENQARLSKKHKEVQKITTKPVCQSGSVHISQPPTHSRSNLEAMKNEAAIHLEREILRASQDVTVKEAELQSVLKDKERLEKKIADLENQLNDSSKRNDKFNEQLAYTGAVWSNRVEEKDKRIAELEKSLINVNSKAIDHQKQLEYERQIEELNLKVKRISDDCTLKLKQVNKNHKSVVAQKDLELKKCQERIAELEKSLNDVNSKAITRQKQLEHDHQKEVERISNDCASKLSQVNKNHKSVVAQKDLELKKCRERIAELERSLINSMNHQKQLEDQIKELNLKIADFENKPYDAHTFNDKFSEQLVHTGAVWSNHVEERNKKIAELEKSLIDGNSKAINHQKQLEHKHQIEVQKISDNSTSKLKQVNKNHRLIVAQKDLELKKCHERIAELEKSLNDVNSKAMDHEKQLEHQIKELNLKIAELEKSLIDVSNEAINRQKQLEHDHQKEVERIFNDCASKLNQVNKNHKSVVAQKDLELKKCPLILKAPSEPFNLKHREYVTRITELEKSRNDEAINHQKQLEHQIKELNLKAASDCTSKLKEANKNHESVVARKDLELKEYQEKLKESSSKLTKAKRDINALQAAVSTKNSELDACHMSLNEKSEKHKEMEVNLNRQVEELRQKKDLELTKAKENYNLLQIAMIQKDEELKQKDKELKSLQQSLLKHEEKSFRFTNAFTSAGEGSVLEMSNRYRHLQHNKRAAAARALRKVQKIDARDHLCAQTMSAYEAAKSLVIDQARHCIEDNLFKLQTDNQRVSCSKELLQGCMVLLSCIQDDKAVKKDAVDQIHKELMDDKPLPSEVEDYYKSLAELAWCAVARPIPMIIAKSPDTYCKAYHELKDGEDVEDGRAVSYVYPVLYTSNEWPRQVALEGRVVLKENNC